MRASCSVAIISFAGLDTRDEFMTDWKLGVASATRIAAIVRVTINSISVTPACRKRREPTSGAKAIRMIGSQGCG